MVAMRVADDLGLGIQLDSLRFTPTQLADAVIEVLNDKAYLQRVLRLTQLSRKYNGCVNGANEIIKLIEESKRKNN